MRGESILQTWGISAEYLTEVVSEYPSLRGMMIGYIAEKKLREYFARDNRASGLRKDDDHDRTKKGDLVLTYKGFEFKIEVKSLQTNTIEIFHRGEWLPQILRRRDDSAPPRPPKYTYYPNEEFRNINKSQRLKASYRGKFQCDASDRRTIKLAGGKTVTTTCLRVGEFDILAAGLFGFREQWDFGFALNRDLPRSAYKKYPKRVREQLLKSMMPVSWPLKQPFVSDPFILLDRLVAERRRKRP